jgi:hypothetical protein
MKMKVIFVLLIVLFLVSVAAIDAKSSGRSGGKSSSSYSKSVSSKTITGDAAKTVGIAGSVKKTHLDFENGTENETAQQSPDMGVLHASLAIGMLLLAMRKRTM